MTRNAIKKSKSRKRLRTLGGRPVAEDYQMVIEWSEEDGCYVTTLPAWQNAKTHGATVAKAAQRGQQVLRLLIDSALKSGERVPEPQRRYSGNLRLRLPVSLHGRLAREAEREGVSLNQWIVGKLTGEESLAALLTELVEKHREPTRAHRAWAKRVVSRGSKQV